MELYSFFLQVIKALLMQKAWLCSWDMRYGDFKISVDLENDSEDLDSILRKEYFSDYVTQVKNMEGVQEVFTYSALPTEFSVVEKILILHVMGTTKKIWKL